jgi:hypothetical protein
MANSAGSKRTFAQALLPEESPTVASPAAPRSATPAAPVPTHHDIPAEQWNFIANQEMLCDNSLTEGLQLLMNQFPSLNTQPTCLSSFPELLQYSALPTIFIHHSRLHSYFTSSTNIGGQLTIYDSLNKGNDSSVLAQLTKIYSESNSSDDPIILNRTYPYMRFKQVCGVDCGCFALAYAVDIANGTDPTDVHYDQSEMRNHLAESLFAGYVKPFPPIPLAATAALHTSSPQATTYGTAHPSQPSSHYSYKQQPAHQPKEVLRHRSPILEQQLLLPETNH